MPIAPVSVGARHDLGHRRTYGGGNQAWRCVWSETRFVIWEGKLGVASESVLFPARRDIRIGAVSVKGVACPGTAILDGDSASNMAKGESVRSMLSSRF